jgi:hypothetical protein
MATTTISMPTVGSVVRVSIPPEVHNDLAKFQKIQKELLGKLGCLGCCSGWDIRFNVQRQFVLDGKLALQEVLR